MKTARFAGFGQYSPAERVEKLHHHGWLSEQDRQLLLQRDETLSLQDANAMIENVVGVLGIPVGLGMNLLVNQRPVVVPMAVEEPSIVAALSAAGKLITAAGGIYAEANAQWIIGQVILQDIEHGDQACQRIEACEAELLAQANRLMPRMVARGGGVQAIRPRWLPPTELLPGLLLVHLYVDTCDAMGANAVNRLCEAMAPTFQKLLGGQVILRILSNLNDHALVHARVELPCALLASEAMTGEQVRDGIVAAGMVAERDVYRACTHNKGIMNGIDAVALATGNDWRSIEAGAHAYAASTGRYAPLSQWLSGKQGMLAGRLTLPIKVGVTGGNFAANPMVQLCHRLLGRPSAKQLAELMAAVGLAQNFAALRALATVGIQRGHMALHARAVMASAGIPEQNRSAVLEALLASGDITVQHARQLGVRMGCILSE